MKEGDFAAMVTSPPYEGSSPEAHSSGIDLRKNYETYRASGGGSSWEKFVASREKHQDGYGNSEGQLGAQNSNTFWSAARTIIEQTHQTLAHDAVAVWVCKRFVRNKAIVDFSAQWAELCEAVGFETVEWIRAWLVEDRGAQWTLEGELDERQVERKSFFRRLAERNGSPRIDWEDVIIMRKI